MYDKWFSNYSCASTISVYQINTETDVDAIRSYKCGHYGSNDSPPAFAKIASLTQDILIKYIIALVHPSIDQGAESELKSEVNALNKTGSPNDEIWYAIWKMHLSSK
jgi:hypothetical protein